MQADKIYIECKDLDSVGNKILNDALLSVSYTNTITTLSPACVINFNNMLLRKFNLITSIFYKYASIDVYVVKNDVKRLKLKGVLEKTKTTAENQTITFTAEITSPTCVLKNQTISSFEEYSELNAQQTIQKILQKSGVNKTYDKIIFPANFNKPLSSKVYSASSQSVYDFLENILSDCNARMFTEVYRIGFLESSVLYLYDTGSYINETLDLNGKLQDDNLLKVECDINYSKFYDKIKIVSDASFEDSDPSQAFATTETLSSLGISNLNKRKNLDIPELVWEYKLKRDSDDVDSSDFASALLRDSLSNGIFISLKTRSIFINPNNPSEGIWKLGTKLTSESELFKTLLAPEFGAYLTGLGEFYFVVSGIEYDYNADGVSCILYITPNDLMQVKG